MEIYVVVMAGGSGTRFWPMSRKKRPKQLLTLTGDRSLLRQTVDRVAPLCPPERVVVITGADHAAQAAEQLPDVPPGQIISEPLARNTAAAAGMGAAWVAGKNPEAVCLVLPADHLITDEHVFLDTLREAARAAAAEKALVTLGLTPRFPATGFGYIEAGSGNQCGGPDVFRVKAFHEKPDLKTATAYLEGGRHLWNSGMFAWRAGVLLDEINTHLPDLHRGLLELMPHLHAPERDEALARIYPTLPSISVDHGVLEKCGHILMVRACFGWSDVGSWQAMEELWEANPEGNACQDGEVLAIESRGNLVSAQGRLTALLGVEGLVAVVTDDVLLILPKDRSQDVKLLVDALKSRGLDLYL